MARSRASAACGSATATSAGTNKSRSSRRRGAGTGRTRTNHHQSCGRTSPFGGGWRCALSKLSGTPMPKLLGLRCRECGIEYPLQATHVCDMCFGPLDAVYDYAALKKVVTKDRIESGPKSIWRYRDLLLVE